MRKQTARFRAPRPRYARAWPISGSESEGTRRPRRVAARPAAHRPAPPPSESPAVEDPLAFLPGHVSEIISPRPSAGASLVLKRLLDQKRDLPLALIDGRDSFDPASRCGALLTSPLAIGGRRPLRFGVLLAGRSRDEVEGLDRRLRKAFER